MAHKRIVLAGGSGNIGKLLSFILIHLEYEVVILSRNTKKSNQPKLKYVQWDGETLGDWYSELEHVDTIINLSGKSIQCRFTESNKKELLDSRILPTKVLGEAIAKLKIAPRLWINFSGISKFEGLSGMHDEYSESNSDTFLAHLTNEWEKTFYSTEIQNTTKVVLRLSPVLSRKFGMLKELYPLAKLGLGGRVADGNQYVSWIHELDLVRLVIWIINHDNPSLIYHASSPFPETNENFMRKLRKTLGTSIGVPLPTILAKVGAYIKGVESDMLLLNNAVKSSKTINEGFTFSYGDINQAFEHLTKK